MGADSNSKINLAEGMEVSVNPQSDRSRKERVTGRIVEILTKSETHTHGILVRLDNGVIGRVKDIVSNLSKAGHAEEEIGKPNNDQVDLADIISGGENHFAEFKSSALWSDRLSEEEINKSKEGDLKQYRRYTSKIIIAKTIAGFLNTDGGALVIGIKENKNNQEDEIIGIESEFGKLKDPCSDGYRRMLIDSIIKSYFPKFIFNHFNSYLKIVFEEIENHMVCCIKINKSDQKVFLNINNKDCFFIRIDASTRQLTGEEIVDYCMRRFS